ncbi:tRNA(Ile)-lysidine synthetase-like protein [Salirhabdus euzebyi]|uniref:tRNA(Ile)-lysidine synthase n=1 Tax=Salirhabdus euzebyi TaxID=394506 RepID=A0A841QAM7_9BACI|nr:tRNA lysidine(34) synthetase TilS [Salirhabdus euzebyi]MBB6455262.1 tRNA(Ile)-lysidine synthetase-like protein [Salirhabdus euzebyi]
MIGDRVLTFSKKNKLFAQGDVVLIAVSGGPDSSALLRFFANIRDRFQLKLVALSVDHLLRGEDSKQDVEYVKKLCEEWDIDFFSAAVDVPKYKKEKNMGTQLAARELRYSFFAEKMKEYDTPLLAMGHHGDDQVETMFMQLMRGSKPKGIPVKREFSNGNIIRPFLCLTKEEIKAYCDTYHIKPRYDASNEESVYTRNAFRLKVIPFLKSYNPIIHENLQLISQTVQEEEAFLFEQAENVRKEVVTYINNPIEAHVNISQLRLYPRPLQRRTFHLILNYLYKNQKTDITSRHIESILSLLLSEKPNASVHLPNQLVAFRSYETLSFTFEKDKPPFDFCSINPGETIKLPDGKLLKVEIINQSTKPDENSLKEFVCSATNISLPLIIRPRSKGDKLSVRGLGGHKKVKDIFIDQKIPKHMREQWPIVTDYEGRILWVIGLKKGEVQPFPSSNKWLRLIVEEN